jgi:hypothetical protein
MRNIQKNRCIEAQLKTNKGNIKEIITELCREHSGYYQVSPTLYFTYGIYTGSETHRMFERTLGENRPQNKELINSEIEAITDSKYVHIRHRDGNYYIDIEKETIDIIGDSSFFNLYYLINQMGCAVVADTTKRLNEKIKKIERERLSEVCDEHHKKVKRKMRKITLC